MFNLFNKEIPANNIPLDINKNIINTANHPAELAEIIIDKGIGCYLIDSQGNKYLDAVSSMYTNIHGHNNKTINDAIITQVNMISHSTLSDISHSPAIKLTTQLLSILPKELQQIMYTDNELSTIEQSLRLAIETTKKDNFLVFSNELHTKTLQSINNKIKIINLPYPEITKYDIDQTTEVIELNDYISKQIINHKKNLAGVIIEPLIQSLNDVKKSHPAILKNIRDKCNELNIPLIFDETMTAFGRTGGMFAFEKAGVIPDILCLGQSLSGGYLPIGAIAVSEKIKTKETSKSFNTKYHSYIANPLSCAAAIANLQLLTENQFIEKIQETIYYLITGLKEIRKLTHVAKIIQEGLIVSITFCKDEAKTPYPTEKKVGYKIFKDALKNGVLLGKTDNSIILSPPLTITKSELNLLLEKTKHSIINVTKGL